jgi:flagellar protein FliO/FliZ
MQWLNELPFADNRVLQIGFLAACGIAALIVLAIVYRLAFANRIRVPGGRTRQPRLGLVDAFSLDGQRQLVLIRRDNIEHLVMIGGPNDVLVESQINRAAVPVRETTQASPLLVPTTPVRQAPLPAPAEAPAKVAPKAQASASTPALAAATIVAPAPPAVAVPPAPIPAPAPPTPPAVPPPVPKAPAPAQPLAPSPVSVSAQASGAEPARPALSAAPATTQASAPVQASAPASSPSRQAEPRPAQPRATMPPPIIPANASPNRGAPVRATEAAPARGASNPPVSSSVALGQPPRRPDRVEPAAAASKGELSVTTVRTEPPAASTGTTVPPASGAPPSQARLTPRTASSGSSFDGAQKTVDARPVAEKTNAPSIGKPTPKADDPFADLDSLEAEMARLLGREKSD